jgi:hypothetical protein
MLQDPRDIVSSQPPADLVNLNALPSTCISPPDSRDFFTLEPVDELLIHEPPFTSQEHPEPFIPIVHPVLGQVS